MTTLALYGPSCVGKTSVARAVADAHGLPVRYCGAIARMRASELGVSLSEVPEAVHQEIDQATRAWVAEPGTRLVEGRFLDIVLVDVPKIILIQLTCSIAERRLRAAQRGVTSIDDEDTADARFRVAARVLGLRPANFTIDTTRLSIDEVVSRISDVGL